MTSQIPSMLSSLCNVLISHKCCKSFNDLKLHLFT